MTNIKGGPVMWVLLGAVLGGGGVYSLGLSRAPQKVHVGAVRADEAAASASASSAAAAQPASGPASLAAASSNALAVSGSVAAASSRAAGTAAPAPGAAPQAPRPAGDRLMVVAEPAESRGGEKSSAFAANAAAPKPEEKPKPAAAPVQAAPAVHTIASVGSVRYGMAGRSELMGRGAGPVYNLKGGDAGASDGDVNKVIRQMGTIVQGAQQQLDQTPMDSAARAQVKDKLQSVTVGLPQSDDK